MVTCLAAKLLSNASNVFFTGVYSFGYIVGGAWCVVWCVVVKIHSGSGGSMWIVTEICIMIVYK